MPIDVPPIETTVSVPQPLQADALNIDKLEITGTDPTMPSMTLQTTAYNKTTGVFSSESETCITGNLYAAAARIPEIGLAVQAVFAATAAFHVYRLARKADLAAAALRQATATNAETQAANAELAAYDARNVAFVSRTDESDQTWTNADAAWKAAQSAHADATAARVKADADVATATAALADPANPPLA